MLTITITNVSGATMVAGTLPAPFNWHADIANNGTLVTVVRVSDLDKVDHRTGFSPGDALQQLVQQGQITVSFANKAATSRSDVIGDLVSNET